MTKADEPLAAAGGKVATAATSGGVLDVSTHIQTWRGNKRTGRTTTIPGQVSAFAFSSSLGAALHTGSVGTRLALYDPTSGAARGGFTVPTATAAELSVSGERIVYHIGRTIRLYNAATRRSTTLAVAKADPIGLSIEGERIAWAENIGRLGRIQAIRLP